MLTGVNFAGAEFNPTFTPVPGTYNAQYTYPSTSSLNYFLNKGLNFIRLPFGWERLQHTLGGPLDSTELSRITAVVNTVTAANGYVVLDPHNYAAYRIAPLSTRHYINSPAASPTSNCTTAHFQDLWTKLANQFKNNSHVYFNLMNEPFRHTAAEWRVIADAAVSAIRATGANNRIYIPGTSWTGAHSWSGSGNAAAFDDISDTNFAMEFHQYFDTDSSGTSGTVVSATIGAERLAFVTTWCRDRGLKASLGEFGVANNATALLCLENTLQYMVDNDDVWESWTCWAAGAWWPSTYIFNIHPASGGVAKPQEAVLLDFVGVSSSPPPAPPPDPPAPPPDPPAPPPSPPAPPGPPSPTANSNWISPPKPSQNVGVPVSVEGEINIFHTL